MLSPYGDASVVGIQRVVNRPSKVYTADGVPHVLAIPNCTPAIWREWLAKDKHFTLRLPVVPPPMTEQPVSTEQPVTQPTPDSTPEQRLTISQLLAAASRTDVSPADRLS